MPSLVAIAPGPRPRLALTADGDEDVTVTIAARAGDGESREVVVPARGAVHVSVAAGDVVRVDPGDGAVRGSVTYGGGGALAGYPVVPADAAAAPVTIRPR